MLMSTQMVLDQRCTTYHHAPMNFSDRLRYWRTKRDLTQEQLAHECGWSGQSRIANYESNGKNSREPELQDVPLIARALEIPVEALLADESFELFKQMEGNGYQIPDGVALTLRESKLIQNYRATTETGKKAVEYAASALSEQVQDEQNEKRDKAA